MQHKVFEYQKDLFVRCEKNFQGEIAIRSRDVEIKEGYETKFFISLFERGFKMMKNSVYFIVIALLVAELLKILIYAH